MLFFAFISKRYYFRGTGKKQISRQLHYDVLLLTFVTFIYSRIKALGITRPLQRLSEGTMLLREGDYSVRVDLILKNEFAELQDTFNDMAERIEHEMVLRKKSENDRRQLILDISHNLKNPLASVSGYAELCIKKPDLSEKERNEYLQVIYNNSQRANMLLNELFELSQLDSPEFVLKLVKTDDSRSRAAGSGLGLSIAKKIAVAHNGDLSLQSGEHQGCTFIITLPLI